jgi:hypothetical protein
VNRWTVPAVAGKEQLVHNRVLLFSSNCRAKTTGPGAASAT